MICQQPHNNIMQRAQLRYAADDERWAGRERIEFSKRLSVFSLG